ncbi:ornithine cyclodeaminase family protein [Kribbella sp. NPDC049584]|uniref:ornithine cyclodeaminase family protein n=1 Tax=Kribbella sp. NPDC049584 TaxID=3154833 RepID=UPI00341A7210
MTLLLTRSDILAALDLSTALAALRAGFLQSADIEPLRIRTDLPAPGTATTLLPGLIPGIPAYTVKVNAKFPDASPALRGIVCLHDLSDGSLLAILDSTTITSWRTGLAAALATDLLAQPEPAADTVAAGTTGAGTTAAGTAGIGTPGVGATGGGAARGGVVGVIGAGAQAGMVVAGLAVLREVSRLVVHDVAPERATRFLAQQGIPGRVVSSPRAVVEGADVVVLATWSRAALLTAADVRPGLHLTTLGADEPGKVELSADLLSAARVVVDDRTLAVQMGALGNVGLSHDAVSATLTEVLTGVAPGRRTGDEVTVYAPVGLPWQDLAIAWPVFQAAQGRGQVIDFLS